MIIFLFKELVKQYITSNTTVISYPPGSLVPRGEGIKATCTCRQFVCVNTGISLIRISLGGEGEGGTCTHNMLVGGQGMRGGIRNQN